MSAGSPPSLLPRVARLMVVGTICLTLGMHWALLQGIAWTGMLISFARQGAMIEAVEKTFDGQHGCALCAKVKEGRDSDQGQPKQTVKPLKKVNAVLVETAQLIAPAAELMTFAPLRGLMVERSELPETPPPRRGLA